MAADHYTQGRAGEIALAKLLHFDDEYCGHLSDQMYESGNRRSISQSRR
jgi:hypothetical protein